MTRNLFKETKNLRNILILIVILAAIPLTVILVQRIQFYLSQAAGGNAKVYFLPVTAALPPDKTVSVMIDSTTDKVGFVNINLVFDATKVRLSDEVLVVAPFTTIISKTTMAQANATGKINLVAGVAPADIAAARSGIFEVAKIKLHAISTQTNANATITNDNTISQIVDLTSQAMVISSDPLTLNLNVATAAPVGSVNMKIQNHPQTITTGGTFTAELAVNTNNLDIVGMDIVIDFDSQKLVLNSVTNQVFSQIKNKVITAGRFSGSLLVNTGEPTVKGSALIPLIFNFTALQPGVDNITISNTSVVAGTGAVGQNLTIVPTNSSITITSPTASPSPTAAPATPTPTGTPIGTTAPTIKPTASPTVTVKPSPTPIVYTPADIDQDGKVNIADYLILFQHYGRITSTVPRADINKDGVINVKDYAQLYESFGF